METTVQAIFDSLDSADLAMRKAKSAVSLSNVQFTPIRPNRQRNPTIIVPIYPLSDSDRAEQTHGNLLPLSSADSAPPSGEYLLRLTVAKSDCARVAANLRNSHGSNIMIQN